MKLKAAWRLDGYDARSARLPRRASAKACPCFMIGRRRCYLPLFHEDMRTALAAPVAARYLAGSRAAGMRILARCHCRPIAALLRRFAASAGAGIRRFAMRQYSRFSRWRQAGHCHFGRADDGYILPARMMTLCKACDAAQCRHSTYIAMRRLHAAMTTPGLSVVLEYQG